MKRTASLVSETWCGLMQPGTAQLTYVGYLAVQALALLVWWPWGDVRPMLGSQAEPRALLAAVIALGATVALYCVRAGGEEIRLAGQRSLIDWVESTPLSLPRIVAGYVGAHLLQCVNLLLLSAPLLMAGFAVGGSEWSGLGWCVGATLVMATAYRLAGAVIFLVLRRRGASSFVALRGLVVCSYLLFPYLLPAASQPMLSYHLLNGGDAASLSVGAVPGRWVFVITYTALSGVCMIMLCRLLQRNRKDRASNPHISPGRCRRGPSP